MARKRHAVVELSRCVACGECYKVCPKKAMEIVKGCYANPGEECVGCGLCAMVCPTNCIAIQEG